MSIAGDLHRLVRLLARLLDYLTHPHVRLQFAFHTPETPMSDTVTLTVTDAGSSPACTATIEATNNGTPFSPSYTFTTSDAGIVTATQTSDPNKAVIEGVKDPAGPSTRDGIVTATINPGFPGVGQSVSGTATVITSGDNVSLVFSFNT